MFYKNENSYLLPVLAEGSVYGIPPPIFSATCEVEMKNI